jgi:hypothetical protein
MFNANISTTNEDHPYLVLRFSQFKSLKKYILTNLDKVPGKKAVRDGQVSSKSIGVQFKAEKKLCRQCQKFFAYHINQFLEWTRLPKVLKWINIKVHDDKFLRPARPLFRLKSPRFIPRQTQKIPETNNDSVKTEKKLKEALDILLADYNKVQKKNNGTADDNVEKPIGKWDQNRRKRPKSKDCDVTQKKSEKHKRYKNNSTQTHDEPADIQFEVNKSNLDANSDPVKIIITFDKDCKNIQISLDSTKDIGSQDQQLKHQTMQ